MNGDLDSTTTVRIELGGRRATVEDVQQALDTLRADGIPGTFEVAIGQSDDRKHEAGVACEDRIPNHRFWIEARRAAVNP